MRAIRNNLAFVLLGIFAVVLVYFMVRLQGLILSTQSTVQPAVTNAPASIQQQPTVLVVATATTAPPLAQADTITIENAGAGSNRTDENVAADQSTPPAESNYQMYGSTIIGAIHVGFVNDRGFNQANDEGLRQMLNQVPNTRLISVDNIPETAEVLPIIEDMVGRGAQIIFTQSFGYLPYVIDIAKRYPDIVFMNAGGFELSENVGTYLANHVEAMYLTGMAAGAATQTGQLGFISAFPMPSSLASVNAFHLGARSVNPNVETRIVNNGAWVDPVQEKLATEALASVGVDVVAMIVDSPITIVETAKERGMYVIGFHSASLQELAPENWLTGVEHTWGNFFAQVVEQARTGEWQSGHIRGGIESDMFGLAPFGPAVSLEMQEQILTARKDIISGRLRIFAGPIVDNMGTIRIPAGRVGDPQLLDETDWLIEGVRDLDVTSVVIQPPPANPVLPTSANAGAANGNDRGTDGEQLTLPLTDEEAVRSTEPVPVEQSEGDAVADLLLGITDHHPECLFFTAVVSQIVQENFGHTVQIVRFDADEEMYQAIADSQEQRTVDLTLCYGDPADRLFLRTHMGFFKHIGDAYWQGPEYRLQVLASTSFAAVTERNQRCLYQFFRNIHFEDDSTTVQSAADWVANHSNLVNAWSECR